jgi:pyrimidine-nucleoside phosphorylase
MNVVEVIKKKRDKLPLTRNEINFIVDSFTKNKTPDYQFSAY